MLAEWQAVLGKKATAFPQRHSHFVMNVHTRWREAAMDQSFISWTRKLFDAAAPYAAGTAYVNFMPADEVDRVEKAYGPNYRRLAKAKRRYDPSNLFRMNQNIRAICLNAGCGAVVLAEPEPSSKLANNRAPKRPAVGFTNASIGRSKGSRLGDATHLFQYVITLDAPR